MRQNRAPSAPTRHALTVITEKALDYQDFPFPIKRKCKKKLVVVSYVCTAINFAGNNY